jgi:hypothetical protein
MLSNCINKSVQVASSTIFGDDRPRVCKLVGLEDVGVWLASDELTRLVYGDAAGTTATVFVPLVQVTYLVAGETPSACALDAASRPPGRSTTRSQGARTRPNRPEAGRNGHKNGDRDP